MLRRIILAVLLTASCLAQDKTPTADAVRMEQIIQLMSAKFMGSVPVARDADPSATKATTSPNWRGTSLTRRGRSSGWDRSPNSLTAAPLLLLEERGKLRVNDPVKKYVPDAPAAWDKFTIFNVLTHTSGIPSLTSFPTMSLTRRKP